LCFFTSSALTSPLCGRTPTLTSRKESHGCRPSAYRRQFVMRSTVVTTWFTICTPTSTWCPKQQSHWCALCGMSSQMTKRCIRLIPSLCSEAVCLWRQSLDTIIGQSYQLWWRQYHTFCPKINYGTTTTLKNKWVSWGSQALYSWKT
jgi:hypothetical protein